MKFIKKMNDMDRAAWKGFMLGVGITILTLLPFVLLALGFIVFGAATHHTHPFIMP